MRSIAAAVLLVLSACASSAVPAADGTPGEGDPPGDGSPSPAASPSPAPTIEGARVGWVRYLSPETGLSFEYPDVPGIVTYRYRARGRADAACASTGSGIEVRWTIERTDEPPLWWTTDSETWGYWAAGLVSPDFADAREGTITDVERWEARGRTGARVISCGDRRTPVEPLRMFTRTDGADGVIFETPEWFGRGRAGVLNLPEPIGDGPFRAIAFSFLNDEPLDLIERVLRSVRT